MEKSQLRGLPQQGYEELIGLGGIWNVDKK